MPSASTAASSRASTSRTAAASGRADATATASSSCCPSRTCCWCCRRRASWPWSRRPRTSSRSWRGSPPSRARPGTTPYWSATACSSATASTWPRSGCPSRAADGAAFAAITGAGATRSGKSTKSNAHVPVARASVQKRVRRGALLRLVVQHHPGPRRREQEADVEQGVGSDPGRVLPHGDQHVDQGRAPEDERHYVGGKAAGLEGVDDADRAQGAQGSGRGGGGGPSEVEPGQLPLRGEPGHRHQHADQEVGDSHAEQGAQRIAQSHLALVERGAVEAPGENGADGEPDPVHSGSAPLGSGFHYSNRQRVKVSTSLTSTAPSSTAGCAQVALSATVQVRRGLNAGASLAATIMTPSVVRRKRAPPPARIAALSACRPSLSQSVRPVTASRQKNCPRLRWEKP